ncbi:hypothetical protein AMECASPLE_025775 [Ameca splendens]|uniref:Uncharacterized protein n=1 Tax=Ameca splendens TaxID=208324 RepID=A0ABV1AB22_9TELE
MGLKAQAKVQKMDGVEDCLEEGAAGGVPRILKPQEEPLHPVTADLDSVTDLLQQFLHVQRDLNERWEKETLRQDQRWCQMQIQINNIRDDLEQQHRIEGQPQQIPPPLEQSEGVIEEHSVFSELPFF